MRRKTNIALLVESVPAVVATFLREARLPASTHVAAIGTKRLTSISRPVTTLMNGVFALKPANADPLLPPVEVAV